MTFHRGGPTDVLEAERVSLVEIAAAVGTPCYVYSRAALEASMRSFQAATRGRKSLICYAMKANSNLAILDIFARLGAGFDIVSGGELARVIAAGGDPRKVVFSGVGKTAIAMRQALEADIRCFNVESAGELRKLEAVAAAAGRKAPISLRVNPDVDAGTHPYISTGLHENKFGIPLAEARALYRLAAKSEHLEVAGVDVHIGSQITDIAPFVDSIDRVLELVGVLAFEGIRLHHIDVGGGLGIRYRDESPPSIEAYVGALFDVLDATDLEVLFEPGRVLVGNAGVLLTRVEYLKPGPVRNFAIVDAAMNDLLRPALYEAWHDIVPVVPRAGAPQRYEVVGPICESGDFLGGDRDLAIVEGDLLAVMSAGAYGMSMASNYNSRPRAAEVMVDGDRFQVVRERESISDLFELERVLSI
ncbi:MAG: diaminopimelate decarboxylase [Burkholderiales bacterium]